MDNLLRFYDDSSFIDENELKDKYGQLLKEESEINNQLERLYAEKDDLNVRLSDLSNSVNDMTMIHSLSKELTDAIIDVSDVATGINNKMKRINTGLNNVQTCQSRVKDLLNLQSCSDAVQKALQAEDYESAAGHVHSFLTTADERLLSTTMMEQRENADDYCKPIGNSIKLLQDATVMLQNKISLHFKEAVGVGDAASVERFFKLFPLVGMRDYGLSQYSTFMRSKLNEFQRDKLLPELKAICSNATKRNNTIFADILTGLFEEIARALESNQPIVETYYGAGGPILTVFLSLQDECDTHVSNFMREFKKIRQLDDIVGRVNEYFRNCISTSNNSNNNATLTNSVSNVKSLEKKVDAKNIDTLLDEMITIHSRYQLYRKFVAKKISIDLEIYDENRRQIERDKFESNFNRSAVCRLMQELTGDYLVLEKYYAEENTKKAVASDQFEEDSQTTSLIDDAFFIARKCIRRANLSGNGDAVCAVINNACAILEKDVCNAIRKKLKQGYASGYLDLTQAYNVVMQGRLQQQSDYEQSRLLFLGHLNNSETCDRYIDTLLQSIREEIRCSESEKLESCLSGLNSVRRTFKNLNEYGLQQLRVTVVKSRIVPWIDTFLSFDHQLTTEEEYSSYEADDPFIRKLIVNLQSLLAEFKPRLTPVNYEALVAIIVMEVVTQLEKVILKSEFTRLGGLALDKEIRTLVGYLSRSTSWSVRDKFARLIQIGTILNLEKVFEVIEYFNSDTSTNNNNNAWLLTAKEVKQVLALRKDFRADDIKRLQF